LFPRFAKKYSLIRAAIDTEKFYTPARKTVIEEPNILPNDIPAATNKKNSPFIFGTISAFTQPGKNIPEMIRAFKYVHNHNPNTRLEIVGDGILRPLIEEAIAYHQLENHVTLHGWQEHVAPFMSTWNAFVMSSLWEGLPCAVVEARSMKLPVITYDTGGISDIIKHRKNGLIYQQKYWLNLANGMLELSLNPHLNDTLSSHLDDLSNFSYHAMVNQHVELYKSL
ncbi:MAG: glycosyltransferase, partial [Candidatus Babeliales bacterium]